MAARQHVQGMKFEQKAWKTGTKDPLLGCRVQEDDVKVFNNGSYTSEVGGFRPKKQGKVSSSEVS